MLGATFDRTRTLLYRFSRGPPLRELHTLLGISSRDEFRLVIPPGIEYGSLLEPEDHE